MKMYLDRILVVEGKEDASYLSNYISSEIVVVNGYELSGSIISYLKNKPVILLLDPDSAGRNIRKKLNSALNDAINVEIDINKCTKGLKNGVAECEINEVLQKLSVFCREIDEKQPDFTVSDLYELGLANNKDLRDYLCSKLNLGKCNFKLMNKRLILNDVKLIKIHEIIEEYRNGN